ncbi:hypothetical protein URH17368_2698 [Alicyclobacillus hesperidum URH17-3-68]|nr:hypothetical protein URH17368_2698 [Alicyclobacillus hesperidum URH17-3-68]
MKVIFMYDNCIGKGMEKNCVNQKGSSGRSYTQVHDMSGIA